MNYGPGDEYHAMVLKGRSLIGQQSEIHCGSVDAGWRNGRQVTGLRCSSHLPVGGDRRYRNGTDFDLDLEFVSANRYGSTRNATGLVMIKFRNLATNAMEKLDWRKARCSVTE
jgi:hypothetical protein